MVLWKSFVCCLLFVMAAAGTSAQGNAARVSRSTNVTDTFTSAILRQNKVGLNTRRIIEVILPPGYGSSTRSYPVVYYLHSIYGKAEWIVGGAQKLSERAFEKGISGEFIIVVPDCSSPNIGSLYENSPVSGRWLDYLTQELVPYIDKKYRTLRKAASRAVIGDFMGGRGALQLGMTKPDLFGVVYGLHPVAVGVGTRPWTDLGVNWDKVFNAKSFADLSGDKYCETWVAICQAFLPNPSRPPFYCDYFIKKEGDRLVVDAANLVKVQRGFHLDETLSETHQNLKSLRALAFDWARYDGNFDHVYAARAFTRKLDDFGIEHEAEEYRGTPWNHTWDDNGRFYARVLPFLGRYLVFE